MVGSLLQLRHPVPDTWTQNPAQPEKITHDHLTDLLYVIYVGVRF